MPRIYLAKKEIPIWYPKNPTLIQNVLLVSVHSDFSVRWNVYKLHASQRYQIHNFGYLTEADGNPCSRWSPSSAQPVVRTGVSVWQWPLRQEVAVDTPRDFMPVVSASATWWTWTQTWTCQNILALPSGNLTLTP